MVADSNKVFSTEQVTELLGLDGAKDRWRVIKFVQSREYGISPSFGDAKGSGSRRLYDLENVCEIALALRLLETGLRSAVIGKVIRQLRGLGKIHYKLRHVNEQELYVAIIRTPETGRPLSKQRIQVVQWVKSVAEAEEIRDGDFNCDLICVPVRMLFIELASRLSKREP